jgi:hypothetical protein
MKRRLLNRMTTAAALALLMCMASPAHAQEEPAANAAPPAPPSNVTAEDHPLDKGDSIDVRWDLSPDDGDTTRLTGYRITRSRTDDEIEAARKETIETASKVAKGEVTERWRAELKEAGLSANDPEQRAQIRERRQEAAEAAKARAAEQIDEDELRWAFVTIVPPGTTVETIDKLPGDVEYLFSVAAVGPGGVRSERVVSATPVSPALQWFDGGRFWLAIITLILCGSVVAFIWLARTGIPLKVRKIAGLEAVDEAVGRATEMGRSCLFIPGIQDMNDIQTIAGITVLARVARTAAEYDAKIEVPTSRSLVMTTARETVQSAFLAAGRPDAYNEDLIYYVTDEQFGYVAYLSGMMVREKPAACFYMGSFFAESLILAETGNSIGAIQVAGTAQPAQLPFFVAACDYTLIGEEFFAASAYLSGSPEELGSLKGQDVGKVIVAIGILVGVIFMTLASIGLIIGSEAMVNSFGAAAAFIRETILT